MRVIVTCGPSHEPIDQVRRLTNFSTGELGLALAAALAGAGHLVLCLKGEGATAQGATAGVKMAAFSTNDDLLRKLEAEAGAADTIFHAAALCDYRVKAVRAADGSSLTATKIPTRSGELTLTLEPTVKVLPRLRAIFPNAKIVGWKYELDGTRDDALALAARQIAECRTDACVVNGTAWGAGFGFVEPGKSPFAIADKMALAAFLTNWSMPA